jgi:hypothetical protein
MTDISSLQQTVAAAQEAFDRTGEQHARSRKHLTSLINIVEENLREKRAALAQNQVQRERMVREYGQLRHMLHALVMTVEVGPREGLAAIPAPAEAGMEPGAHPGSRMGPVSLEPAANDAGPAGNGADENGPARNGGDDSERLRAGLKRVIKRKRAQAAKADKPEEPAPAT